MLKRPVALLIICGGVFLGWCGNAGAWCFREAGMDYGVHPRLLMAIARNESGMQPNIVRQNKNGTIDVGLMQVNSSWFPVLQRYGHDPAWLRDPCYNVRMGAWILAHEIQRFGLSWQAVGAYHSKNPERQQRYAVAVYRQMMKGGK